MADNIVHTTSTTGANDGHSTALATPGDKREPPSEWASSTLEAMGPVASHPASAIEGIPGQTGMHETSTHQSSTADVPKYPSSTATTPGFQVPGAFPRGNTQSSALSQDATQNVKEATVNALETAKGYVVSAGQTVGGYFPQSMAAYLPQSQSQPTSSEVAELPEQNTEATKVPYNTNNAPTPNATTESDLASHEKFMSETLRDTNVNGPLLSLSPSEEDLGASADASTRSLAGSRVDTLNRNTPGTSILILDSDRAQGGSAGGQDKLDSLSTATGPHRAESSLRNTDTTMKTSSPASAAAAKAAVNELERPDLERHADETHRIPSEALATDTTDTNGHAPDTKSPKHFEHPNTAGREYPIRAADVPGFPHQGSVYSDATTPGHGPLAATVNTGISRGKESGAAGTGVVDAHPSANHTASPGAAAAETDSKAANTNAGSTSTPQTKLNAPQDGTTKDLPTAPDATTADSKEAPTPSSGKAKRKSGFMDKLRGEMKVLSGKLEHKQEKVEEGRRMMGKSASKN